MGVVFYNQDGCPLLLESSYSTVQMLWKPIQFSLFRNTYKAFAQYWLEVGFSQKHSNTWVSPYTLLFHMIAIYGIPQVKTQHLLLNPMVRNWLGYEKELIFPNRKYVTLDDLNCNKVWFVVWVQSNKQSSATRCEYVFICKFEWTLHVPTGSISLLHCFQQCRHRCFIALEKTSAWGNYCFSLNMPVAIGK